MDQHDPKMTCKINDPHRYHQNVDFDLPWAKSEKIQERVEGYQKRNEDGHDGVDMEVKNKDLLPRS